MPRIAAAVLFVLLVFGALAPVSAQAQDAQSSDRVLQRRVTLFDMLFGPRDETPPPADTQPAQQPKAPVQRVTRPAPPPPPPAVDKVEGATRLAVMGDSLATDLAKALERSHAEDPNLQIVDMGVGSSGFVRDDYYDWNKALADAIANDSFDMAVVMIGINDRQTLRDNGTSLKPLTDEWKSVYSDRLKTFLDQLRAANKPVIWVGLPPMRASSYSAAISQIASLQQLAAFGAGAQYVDIFDRFADENGQYSSYGPDLNGQNALMRKSDGIHFANAGADKLAFYVNQSLKLYYHGGTLSFAVADPLEGTDAQAMVRLPYQGLGQIRHLEVAGPVMPLEAGPPRADTLMSASDERASAIFSLQRMVAAPLGRADAFGVGIAPPDAPPQPSQAEE
ncbi:MAG TPA: DUF459 domain-containing protein [Devosiaceae bacterium]